MELIDRAWLDRIELDSTRSALNRSLRIMTIKDTTLARQREQIATMQSHIMAEQTRAASWQAQVAITERYYKKVVRQQKRKTLGTGVLGILATVGVAVFLTR